MKSSPSGREVRAGWVVVAVATSLASGCGGTLYAVQANSAATKLEQARQLDAERLAPFEYFYAREYMNKAMSEAAEGDYGDALDFADVAEKKADDAIKLSRAARRGAGR